MTYRNSDDTEDLEYGSTPCENVKPTLEIDMDGKLTDDMSMFYRYLYLVDSYDKHYSR